MCTLGERTCNECVLCMAVACGVAESAENGRGNLFTFHHFDG